jgi:ATP-binding cassette subfamily B (MDR/TAP) protein 1
MAKSKFVPTHFMTNYKLFKDMGPQSDVNLEAMQAILFQNVIGSFMYAMVCIRPNIAHAMGVVSYFMANPK